MNFLVLKNCYNISRSSTTVSIIEYHLIEITKEDVDFLIKQDEKVAFNIEIIVSKLITIRNRINLCSLIILKMIMMKN